MSVARLRLPLPPHTASAELAAIVAPLIGSTPAALSRAWESTGQVYSGPLESIEAELLAGALMAFHLAPEIVPAEGDPPGGIQPAAADQHRGFLSPEKALRAVTAPSEPPPRVMPPSEPPPRVMPPSQIPLRVMSTSLPPPRAAAPGMRMMSSVPPPRVAPPSQQPLGLRAPRISSPPPPLHPIGLPAPKRGTGPAAAIEAPSTRLAAAQAPMCHPARAHEAIAASGQAEIIARRQRAQRRTTFLMLAGISVLVIGAFILFQ